MPIGLPAAMKDGMPVFGEIPHRAMPPRVEDGVEVFLLDAVEANGLVQLSFRSRVLLEPHGEISSGFGFVALGIERRASAFRRCERDLDTCVLENVVRGCELFEPESCLSPSVAQLAVGCDDHQYFHDFLLCMELPAAMRVRAAVEPKSI